MRLSKGTGEIGSGKAAEQIPFESSAVIIADDPLGDNPRSQEPLKSGLDWSPIPLERKVIGLPSWVLADLG